MFLTPRRDRRTLPTWRIAAAFALAERGAVAAGDALLHEGLRCAATLCRNDSPHGVESLLRFQGALVRYARRFGVRIQ